MSKKAILVLLLAAFFGAASLSADTLYVKSTGVGVNTGAADPVRDFDVVGETNASVAVNVAYGQSERSKLRPNQIEFYRTSDNSFIDQAGGAALAFRVIGHDTSSLLTFFRLYNDTANHDNRAKFYVDVYNKNNVIFSSSDVTLKTDIAPLDGALDKILSVTGVSYQRKSNGRKEIGLIAQDIERVFPEAVATEYEEEEGRTLKYVAYDSLIAPLIEAVKEQQTEILTLEKRIVALEALVAGKSR